MSHPRRLLPIAAIAGLSIVMILASGVGHAASPPGAPAAATTLLLIDTGRLNDVRARLKRGGDDTLAAALVASNGTRRRRSP